MKPRLYIFAKAPRIGKVKTRLAADVGDVHAWRIYRAMTAKILREMQDPRWHTILYGMETKYKKPESKRVGNRGIKGIKGSVLVNTRSGIARAGNIGMGNAALVNASLGTAELNCDFGGLWPNHIPRLEQCAGGLSERTAMLFEGKGPLSNKGSVITIGTDIPAMKRADIAAGFKALKHNDAVVGPAKDGGFYLIGLNAPASAGLFDGVRWSHKYTRKDMCAAIDGKIAFLRELEDVDDLAGYRRYKRLGRG